MGRGGIPLRPPAGTQPRESNAAPLIPGLPDGKVQAQGPLGGRGISPKLLEQLKAAREGRVPAPGEGIQMGGIPQSTPVVPEQPSALDYEESSATPAAAPKEEQKVVDEGKGRGSHDGAGGILDNVAMTGVEFRANPILARDDEFLSDIWWMSDPKRRAEIDARCDPIDWSGFATGMDITQRVHMWTDPFDLWIKFRKVKGSDEMMARKILAKNYGGSPAESEVGLLIVTAAACVVEKGEQRLPAIPTPFEKKDPDERFKVFMERVDIASNFDMTLLRDIVINYAWFVRRATIAVRGKDKGSLGNG